MSADLCILYPFTVPKTLYKSMTWFYLLFFHSLVKEQDPTLSFICTKSSSSVYASTYQLYLFLKILIWLAWLQTMSWRQASVWWTQRFGGGARAESAGGAVPSRSGTWPFRSHKLHVRAGPGVTPRSQLPHRSASNGGERRCCSGRRCQAGRYAPPVLLALSVRNCWIRNTRGYIPASSF